MPTDSMRTLKYFFTDAVKNKSRFHQLDFIGAFLQIKFKNRVFVKLYIRYADNFPEYSNYLVRVLRLLKYMYGITNSGCCSWWVNRMVSWSRLHSISISDIYILQVCTRWGGVLFYIMFMTVSIGIILKLLDNSLWTL